MNKQYDIIVPLFSSLRSPLKNICKIRMFSRIAIHKAMCFCARRNTVGSFFSLISLFSAGNPYPRGRLLFGCVVVFHINHKILFLIVKNGEIKYQPYVGHVTGGVGWSAMTGCRIKWWNANEAAKTNATVSAPNFFLFDCFISSHNYGCHCSKRIVYFLLCLSHWLK